MNFNSDFDLKKAKSFLLTESEEDYGTNALTGKPLPKPDPVVEAEELDEGMTKENIINILKKYENPTNPFHKSNFSDYITDLKSYEYEGMSLSDMNSEEDVITDYKKWKKSDPVVEAEELDEMAKIAGDLKSAIEAVLAANPELEGLALKKAIKGDSSVINALDGEDLYDNQLNKFISLSKGEREVGQRGRKANPDAAPKAEKSPKIKIVNPKVAAAASTKLADLAPASVFSGGEEDEEEVAAEKQAIAAAKGGKRLGSAAEKLAQVTKEMKALIPAYQAAKGTPEAAAITAQLKDLTAEKKALEAKVFK